MLHFFLGVPLLYWRFSHASTEYPSFHVTASICCYTFIHMSRLTSSDKRYSFLIPTSAAAPLHRQTRSNRIESGKSEKKKMFFTWQQSLHANRMPFCRWVERLGSVLDPLSFPSSAPELYNITPIIHIWLGGRRRGWSLEIIPEPSQHARWCENVVGIGWLHIFFVSVSVCAIPSSFFNFVWNLLTRSIHAFYVFEQNIRRTYCCCPTSFHSCLHHRLTQSPTRPGSAGYSIGIGTLVKRMKGKVLIWFWLCYC